MSQPPDHSRLRRICLRLLLGGAALFGASQLSAQGPADARTPLTAAEKQQGYSNRAVLAKLKDSADTAEATLAESREGNRSLRSLAKGDLLRVLELPAGETVDAALERLRATGRYDYVEPDYLVSVRATPNDPRFLAGDQWALRNIGQSGGVAGADIKAEAGWDIQTNASNVVVAVIDSGMRTNHGDLAPNLFVNTAESGGVEGRDDDNNGFVDDINGINATVPRGNSNSGLPADEAGHGTAVASVIGGAGNNNLGMTGVAWNVKLMPLRFIDSDGYGFVSDEIVCIDYAIAKGAHLINASFGGAPYSQSLYNALRRARDANIIVVCAAGNETNNLDLTRDYPAGYLLDNIIAVANTNRTDTLAASSSYGSGMVELGAPGTSILVAGHNTASEYLFVSGTSFSAPMVTGALALLKAKFPTDTYRESINRLLRGVDRIPALAGKTSTGGRLNLSAALRTTTARPFNDDFASRPTIVGSGITVRAGLRHATREAGEPTHGGAAGSGSLWWTWVAPRAGAVTFDTGGTNADTLLSVYTGTSLGTLTSVGSNDNDGTAETSKVTFNAVAGTTYQIAVDARNPAATALAVLNVNFYGSNDAFDAPQIVTGQSWSVSTHNNESSRENGEPRIRGNNGGRSVWFRWVAPASRRYQIATWSTKFDTMLGVYTGTSVATLSEVATSLTAGDSNRAVVDAAVSFTATAGTTYHIVVDSQVTGNAQPVTGEFRLACIDSEWEAFGYGTMVTASAAPDGSIITSDIYGDVYAFRPDGSRKWRFEMVDYAINASPTVAPSGVTYAGDLSGYLYAINPDGSQKWRFRASNIIISAAALASDGTIYVRSADGQLYALNPDTGTSKWSFRFGSNTLANSAPVVAPNGNVYCVGADARLYAFSPAGSLLWASHTEKVESSPALGADGTIYLGTTGNNKLLAFKPDGTVNWEFNAGGGIATSIAIGLDGNLYFGALDKKIYAISPTGTLRWIYETEGEIRDSSPLVASDGSIFVGSRDGKMYHLESNGTLRRTYCAAESVRSSPLLHNGRLYFGAYDWRMYSVEVGLVPASTPWPMDRQNVRRSSRAEATPLTIALQPRSRSAEVGDTITFSVGAVGGYPLRYQWLFKGEPITGATGTTYRVDPVTHDSRGDFSVRVTDPSGTVTSSAATLTVTTPLLPPTIHTAPLPQTVIAGNSVTLSVAALGTEPFTYQWQRNGVDIPGATSSSYTIVSPRPTDSGSYAVVITNRVSTITSAAATLTINPITRISNLSIRTQVGGDSGLLTVGVTIGGAGTTGTKPLLLRAVGPTLAAFGVEGALADPKLAILSGANTVAQNDNWAGNAQITTANAAVGAFGLSAADSKDAALLHSAAAGSYTVQIDGAAGTTGGIALAEVYDTTPADTFGANTPRLINVSALTQVGTGGDILIAGFSITGTAPRTVLVRAIGPTLEGFGVGGALADPRLELYRAGGAEPQASNDNWGAAANASEIAPTAARVGAFALAAGSRDAVILTSLPPGSYTAQVSGVGGSTGKALVEVYEVP